MPPLKSGEARHRKRNPQELSELISDAAEAMHKAYEQAKLAYRFGPGSYTYSAFRSAARAYQLAATARNAMQAASSRNDGVNNRPPLKGDRAAHSAEGG
jgi:hypothetical protein